MPLAKYITAHLATEAFEAVALIKEGFYKPTELESLAKHENREEVLEAISQKLNEIDAVLVIPESEMMPAEEPNHNPIGIPTTVAIATGRAIDLVEFSKKFAKVSVICAAQAGAEFSKIKSDCPRGIWMRVLKTLPFSTETVRKYIKVAEELQARLSEENGGFNLLELPSPEELITGDHSDVVDLINQVTGEQTLRQLYFDWGIVRKAKALGGHHPKAGPPATPEQQLAFERKMATEAIGTLCYDIQALCIGEKRKIQLAEMPFLQLLEGDLIDAIKNVRTLIKAG